MDDKNRSNVQHPIHAVLITLHAKVRTAFETAAAFWRPWFREPEKKDVAAKGQSKAASEEAPQPTKREEKAREKKPKAPIKRAQRPRPLTTQEATMKKKPKAPIKRSSKDEQELEREELAQKTERLRELRLAKEAADREKNPPRNGKAQPATKK
jgi:organic radical activating enzyme